MRLCSHCGEVYDDQSTECRQDGTPLVPWVTGSIKVELLLDPRAPKAAKPAVLAPTHDIRNGAGASEASESVYIDKLDDPPEASETTAQERILAKRYAMGKQLGVGGFGVVFEGRDLRLDKPVAIKLLSPRVSADEEALTRFRVEALTASRIGHENIVAVTDFDRDDGTSFIVMELLQGRDLAATLEDVDHMPPARALAIAAQVAYALNAAHRKGIVHRDLKPANVYLVTLDSREDFVKVIDFGISKVMTEAARGGAGLTERGIVLGTPRYMAPEQARGERDLDGRVDVYALGVMLFEMLAGETPFDGRTQIEVVSKHLTAEPPRLVALRPELAAHPKIAALEALVARTLAKDPAARHATMEELGQAIMDLLAEIDPIAANIVRPNRMRSGSASPASGSRSGASSMSVQHSVGEIAPSEPMPRGGSRRWIVGGALAAASAVAVVMFLARGHGRTAATIDVAEPPLRPTPVALPPAPVAAVAPAPEPARTAAQARTVRVSSNPPGAEAFGDGGAPLGRSPVDVAAPQGEGTVRVLLRAEGYLDREVLVHADTPTPLEVPLERARGHARKPSGARPGRDIARDW